MFLALLHPYPLFPLLLVGVIKNRLFAAMTQSDTMGMAILIACLIFSILSWTVIIAKSISLRAAARSSADFIESCKKSNRLSQGYAASKKYKKSPVARMYRVAYAEVQEWEQSYDPHKTLVQGESKSAISPASIKILERVIDRAIADEARHLESHLQILATASSVCPMIGLFGTVWGILMSFQSMAAVLSADIATVAPGISVALTTTVAGLAVAIPSNIAYNALVRKVNSIVTDMEIFGSDFVAYVEKRFLVKG